ncbi:MULTISPECIES: glycosyltransferase family 2 protein [unclassified Phenylobacterium]|uniref:glycosyltransferase family 2 protein n=1 Tax=unclassified Phenylobacterium TaxID=2640670 RepID=UPI000AE5A4C5|nr:MULTISPECIES: glycosyltransferase [unclassified Phenylobacterium]
MSQTPAALDHGSRPRVSVVVPHYNDLVGLDRCLSALQAQTLPAGEFEIIVADNASPVGEAAVAEAIGGRARLVVVTERGAGPARNGGVALAGGEILAFTDSDCIPSPQWLSEGLAALGRSDFVGGGMEVLVGDAANVTGAEAFELVFAFDNQAYVERKGFTVTANLFCPAALFRQVGGFRVGVSEDLEWSHRARDAGFAIGYAPRALVAHPARRTWAELTGKWRRLNHETFGIVAARPRGRLTWLVRSLLLPLSALAHTPRVLTSPRLRSARQKTAALVTLYRLRIWRAADALSLLARTGA